MGNYIQIFFKTFINLMSFLLMAYCIVSWILPPYNEFRSRLDRFMGTFLDPIRKYMPSTGMVDFSPIILMLLLQFLEMIINRVF